MHNSVAAVATIMSVCPSVCHSRESRLNGFKIIEICFASDHRTMCLQFLAAMFRNFKFIGSDRRERDVRVPHIDSENLTNNKSAISPKRC